MREIRRYKYDFDVNWIEKKRLLFDFTSGGSNLEPQVWSVKKSSTLVNK